MSSKKKVTENIKKHEFIKDNDILRDPSSGAVVFPSNSDYQQVVRRKREATKNNKNISEIRQLQRKVAKLEAIVNELINSKK